MSQLVKKARRGRRVALLVLARRKAEATTTLVLQRTWIVPHAKAEAAVIPVSFMRARAGRAIPA